MRQIYSIASGLLLFAGMLVSSLGDWNRSMVMLIAAVVVQLFAIEERIKDAK